MNHLAHSFLSCDDNNLLIGNLVADFVNKKEATSLNEVYQKGILLHRKIDKFMDKHIITVEAVQLLRPSQKKYAPVSIDLLWDYFLCQNWNKYNKDPYQEYCDNVYVRIRKAKDLLPGSLQTRFDKLISYNFLGQYMENSSFEKVLIRMDSRANFPSNFQGMIKDIEDIYEKLNELFNSFFPEAIDFARTFVKTN